MDMIFVHSIKYIYTKFIQYGIIDFDVFLNASTDKARNLSISVVELIGDRKLPFCSKLFW